MDEWWSKKSIKKNIVVQHTDAIAVYFNPEGNVVIRQECDPSEIQDQFVFFDPHVAHAVAQAIISLVEKRK